MKKIPLLYLITFTVAFCSLVYELVLGQALTAFFGNTVLRYSVTIGLYLFAMGFGAMLAEGKFVEKPVVNFMRIELALTLVGGLVVVIFFLLSFMTGSGMLFSLFAHLMIIVIGVLTGFEIPLLIELAEQKNSNTEAYILAVDYAGAFAGAIIFALVFYPKFGLVSTAFFVGLLNSLAGIAVFFYSKKQSSTKKSARSLSFALGLLALAFIILLFNAQSINNLLIENYLN